MISTLVAVLLAQSTLNQSLPLTREADGGWAVRVWMDTSLVCGGGSGGASPLTTKGDLYTYSTVDARLPVGADGECLTADSAQATGLLWSACGSGGGAPTTASFITKVAEASLSNEFAMGTLATGIVKNTTTTGVPSIAVSGTDYAPATSGSTVLLGNGSGGFSSYAGTSCTNQFARSLSTAAAATCAGVGTSDFTANQGSTTTLLHGNAAGQPSWAGVSLTNDATANQGTTAQVLHGNAAGQPSFSAVNLANDTTGTLTVALGGTGAAPGAGDQVLVSDSTSGATWRAMPDCTDTGGNHINYTAATNLFSCGTSSSGGGGGAPTTATYWTATSEASLSAETNLGALTTGMLKHTVTTGTSVPSTATAGTDYSAGTAALGTGILKSTTGTGALTIATASTDYAPATSGSAILKGNGSGGFSSAVSRTDYGESTTALATGILKNTTTTGAHTIAAAGTDYGPPTSANATGLVLSTTTTGAHTAYAGTSCTNQFPRSLNGSGAATCASVASADLSITATSCTNQFVSAVSTTGVGTCTTSTLAGAQHANQGTATTLLHGNAAGNPAWSGVAIADLTATGTPSSTTFLRGDNTWSAPPGGGVSVTTKGDLQTFDTAAARLPTSTDGLCLKTNSGTGTGLEWASCGAAGSGLTYAEVSAASLAGF